MPENNTEDTQHGFWEFKKYKEHEWFKFLILSLVIIVVLYVPVHVIFNAKQGYEYTKLNKEQLQQLNRIYFDSANAAGNGASTQADTSGDEDGAVEENPPARPQNIPHTGKHQRDSINFTRVINYITAEFNNKVDRGQLERLSPYLRTASPLEAIQFLADVRLQIQSYFWLTGPGVYFEIIFWSWFGVIASLLFNLGVVARNRTTNPVNQQSEFDSSEIPSQFAKLGYAPLCTLAIVLGYNYFNDQNIVDISSSKGVIVFAFVGGFYSARLIAFLDRLKEVILPNSGTADLPVQGSSGTAIVLNNISVDLQLDDETIPADTRNEIAEMSFGDASVTFHNDENGEIITAERKGEDQSATFNVASISPGKYTIKARWSKQVNNAPVNLEGEQKEELKNSGTSVAVVLKKAADEG